MPASGERSWMARAAARLVITISMIAKATMKKIAEATITSSNVKALARSPRWNWSAGCLSTWAVPCPVFRRRWQFAIGNFMGLSRLEVAGVRLHVRQTGDYFEPDVALFHLVGNQDHRHFIAGPVGIKPNVRHFIFSPILAVDAQPLNHDFGGEFDGEDRGAARRRRFRHPPFFAGHAGTGKPVFLWNPEGDAGHHFQALVKWMDHQIGFHAVQNRVRAGVAAGFLDISDRFVDSFSAHEGVFQERNSDRHHNGNNGHHHHDFDQGEGASRGPRTAGGGKMAVRGAPSRPSLPWQAMFLTNSEPGFH